MVIGYVGDASVRYITIFLISYISINICMYRLVPIIISAIVIYYIMDWVFGLVLKLLLLDLCFKFKLPIDSFAYVTSWFICIGSLYESAYVVHISPRVHWH